VRRRLLKVLMVLSLLLCVAVVVLWVRSYWRGDCVSVAVDRLPRGIAEWFVRSNDGVLYFARNDYVINNPGYDPRPLTWDSHEANQVFASPSAQARNPHFVLGPFSLGGGNLSNVTKIAFTIPHWFPAALAAVVPTIWLARSARARRRRRGGFCVRCGYNLRATPGRCPECGWEAAGVE
jgi:hypothetical protein